MPVIKKPFPAPSRQHVSLVNALAKELQRDSPNGPTIVEQEQRSKSLLIHVIWDRWRDLPHEERSRIIMDAYAKQRAADVVRIAVALGVTKAEAEKLGISA